jgi:hypothetical protein
MNIQAVNKTLALPMIGKASKKLVLVSLANRADESGICWPSQKNIAAQAGVSLDTVQRCLSELVEEGLVSHVRRKSPMRGRASDLYTLSSTLLQDDGIKAAPCGLDTDQSRTTPAIKAALVRLTEEPSIEPSLKKESGLSFFDEFMRVFPDRKGADKSQAERPARIVFDKRIKEGADPLHIIADARQYAEQQRNKDSTFTKLPQTWLQDWSHVEAPKQQMVNPGTPEWYDVRANYEALGHAVYVEEMDRAGRAGKAFPVIEVSDMRAKAA